MNAAEDALNAASAERDAARRERYAARQAHEQASATVDRLQRHVNERAGRHNRMP